MKLSIIVIGVNKWKQYTRPLLNNLLEYKPQDYLLCVDGGSSPAYPKIEGVFGIRVKKTLSYAANMNIGIKEAPTSDWYMVLNNDVIVSKDFRPAVEKMQEDTLYGFVMHVNEALLKISYMSTWGMFISSKVIEDIGLFDEKFAPMYFEDADYCLRAIGAGYKMSVLDRAELGIYHIEDERMQERREYMRTYFQFRQANRAYLRSKHGLS